VAAHDTFLPSEGKSVGGTVIQLVPGPIYRRAAELKKKDMEQLVYSIFENAKGVFDFSV
jgi:hypothetical protein